MKWIEWKPKGKYRGPLQDYIWCEVMMADGELDQSFAMDFNWGVEDEPGEIIAYRTFDPPGEFEKTFEENFWEVMA